MIHVPLPLTGNVFDIELAFVDKRFYPDFFFNVFFSLNLEFFFNLVFCRQAMAIPSPHATDAIAFHGPKPGKYVFGDA